tara:strand:+ start:44200 stop:45390 length:1191 start_codon:yes stop_codon:yes gene_type:complete
VDHVVAQTASFSGANVLLQSALAVSAAASYAVFRGGSSSTKTGAVTEPAAHETSSDSAVSESELEEMRSALAEAQAALNLNAEKTVRQELENAQLKQRLQETRIEISQLAGDKENTEISDDLERASVLVENLESQIEGLQTKLVEEQLAGDVAVEDADSRAAQLADQLQATQRTANKLSGELETYRKEAHDFDAKQALTNLQLKSQQEKIELLEKKVAESSGVTEQKLKEKQVKINELTKNLEKVSVENKSLAERLEETEARLELEKAGSLAAAKKKAMAMLNEYDVTNMGDADVKRSEGEMSREYASPQNSQALAEQSLPPPPPVANSETTNGEWLQAYDVERDIHYWYNNLTLETVWELPDGARVHESSGADRNPGRDEDLPKHFEGPSGLNSR